MTTANRDRDLVTLLVSLVTPRDVRLAVEALYDPEYDTRLWTADRARDALVSALLDCEHEEMMAHLRSLLQAPRPR